MQKQSGPAGGWEEGEQRGCPGSKPLSCSARADGMVLALSCPEQELLLLLDLSHASTLLLPSCLVSDPLSCPEFNANP